MFGKQGFGSLASWLIGGQQDNHADGFSIEELGSKAEESRVGFLNAVFGWPVSLAMNRLPHPSPLRRQDW